MIYLTLTKQALKNLLANKGKSLLTMLGIIIAVASVVIIISVGAGAQSLIFNQIEEAGSNLIGIIPGGTDDDEQGPPASVQGIVVTTLKYDDYEAIMNSQNVPNAVAGSPYVRGSMVTTYEGKTKNMIMTGVSHQFLSLIDADVEDGRFFTKDEEKSMARVAVLGIQARYEFFGVREDPIGKFIRMDKKNFKVIGVLEERGTRGFENQDEQIYIPALTAQKIMLGINHVGLIRIKVDSPENLAVAVEDIKALLRERHGVPKGREDFTIANQKDALVALGGIMDALRFFLAAVAAISLLVGGVGVMNIMFVTVTERTQEIGLRKAIGARESSILQQFLFESTLLSVIGGLIGLFSGAIISYLIALVANYLGYEWAFIVSANSIILAITVSGGTGIIFGLYPARQASKLNPIEALRYE